MESVESRLNSSGTFSQDSIRCSSMVKVKDLLSRLGETPENFTGRILFMSMFNDISCGTKDNERECLANAKVVSLYARKFGTGQSSFIGPGSEKNGTPSKRTAHKEFGTISRKRCCWNLPKEQSDEIFGVNTTNWEDSAGKHLSLVGGEKVISLSHTKVYVFSDSVLCFGKMSENPQSNYAWEDRLMWFKSSSEYRALDTIDGEPMGFEWNIFPGFTTLQLSEELKSSCLN